jgi:hypothetical protein
MAQHDYVLANAAGAAFRADINNALAAIVSQNSGPNEPNPTFAYQLWADTTAGQLKIRNAANNAWIVWGALADVGLGLLSRAGGTMTGALLQLAGTAAAPGLAIAGDADTGLYGKAADELGIAVAGALAAWFSADGLNLPAQDDVRFWDSDSSHYVGFQAPATVTTNRVWTLPATDGTTAQALTTNGSNVLGWSTLLAQGAAITAGTSVATTSGTAIDFTGIPSWAKRITVMFSGVSTSGANVPLVQLGDSGGFETSGYTISTGGVASTPADTARGGSSTDGIRLAINSHTAADLITGKVVLANITGNTWIVSGVFLTASVYVTSVVGSKALSATLDRLRITTNSADTFDAGTVNILWEG